MSVKKSSLIKRFHDWQETSIANRITFAAALLIVSVVGFAGIASFIINYLQIERSVRHELGVEANLMEERLGSSLDIFTRDLASLSNNTLVATGLLDSHGRETYLTPFLRDYRSSLEVPVTLSLHDFQGNAIAGNNPGGLPSFHKAPWLESVITQARPHADFFSGADGNYLRLAYPVLYPSTGRAEGMLVAEFNLTKLFRATSRQGNAHFAKHFLDGKGTHIGEPHGHERNATALVLRRPLKLAPPLAAFNLQVEVSAARGEMLAPLFWMIAVYLAVGSLALLFVLWATRRGVVRLIQPLVELSEFTEEITASNLSIMKVPVVGRDETAKLAQSFNIMIDGLNASYQMLERRIAERTCDLKELNDTLEKRVCEEAAKNREKDLLLIQQSRLAAMGEMIGNIAHQWRQPLNTLGLLLANIKDAYDFNELTPEYLNDATHKGNQLVQKMSTTIDDFRNFFRPNREKQPFSLMQSAHTALELVEASFKNHEIEIELKASGDAQAMGFTNEYSQVLLNILGNARDAIIEHHMRPGRVSIEIGHDDENGYVVVHDNGGGIPEAMLGKIFDPYFTTREMGTGIGLYMSKMIVESNMHGRIEVRNIDGGAEFRIVTPLVQEAENCV